MKSRSSKQQKQMIKLPSIGNKTMGDIYKDSIRQKQRPLSSKSIVSDLEKKLFCQLDTYQQKNMIKGGQKRNSKMKSRTNESLLGNSCKDILSNGKSQQLQSMQKIAQLMPQLYSKIIQSKKYEDVKPLKQTFSFNNEENCQKQQPYQDQNKNRNEIKKIVKNEKTSPVKTKNNSKTLSKDKKQQIQLNDSFSMAQNEMNTIYKDYLQKQGLGQQQTSISQLVDLNKDLGKCQQDIEQLQRNYSKLIKQLSEFCINETQ